MSKPSPAAPPKKASAPGKGPKAGRLPLLLESTYSLARLIVTLLGILVAVISLLSGSTVVDVAIRAGAAIFLVGLVLALVFWIVAGGSLSPRPRVDVKKAKRSGKKDAPASTVEVNA